MKSEIVRFPGTLKLEAAFRGWPPAEANPPERSVAASIAGAAILIFAACGTVNAQAVWDLVPGDRFAVEHIVHQETSVALEEGAPRLTKTNERIVIAYQVRSVRPDQTILQVHISQADLMTDEARTAEEGAAHSLTGVQNTPKMTIVVDGDGVVRSISGFSSFLDAQTGGDDRTSALLRTAVPEQAFRSWITLPFWITPPAKDSDDAASWERLSETSLGLMGTVRNIMTFELKTDGDPDDENSFNLKITCNSRHVPFINHSQTSDGQPDFSDVTVEQTEFQGSAAVRKKEMTRIIPNAAPTERNRPWFESMTLSRNISGSATARFGGMPHKISFQQTQTLVSRLLPNSWRPALRYPPPDGPPQR